MKKGFIGPLGDDLPSLIAIMLALTLFFSGLTFAMHTFNERQGRVRLMKGAVDISRAIVREPVIEDPLINPEAKAIAKNNELAFNVKYGSSNFMNEIGYTPIGGGVTGCDDHSIHFSYLVSKRGNGDEVTLDIVRVCVWEAKR